MTHSLRITPDAISSAARMSLPIPVIFGALAWASGLGLLVAVGRSGWAEAFLLFSALVIVPLGMRLISQSARIPGPTFRLIGACHLLSALLLIPAFALPRGVFAGVLVLPYLAATSLSAMAGIAHLHRGFRPLHSAAVGVALVYLLGAGGWTLLTRLGVRPVEFDDQIVQLTAVHLHYVGFALPLLAALATQAKPGLIASVACLGAILGFPLVATAMTITQLTENRTLELAAVGLFAVSCCCLAIVQALAAVRLRQPTPLALLLVSAISLVTAMILAVVYAIGQAYGSPSLDIPTMLPTHGALNAFGFVFAGLVAWHSLSAVQPAS